MAVRRDVPNRSPGAAHAIQNLGMRETLAKSLALDGEHSHLKKQVFGVDSSD